MLYASVFVSSERVSEIQLHFESRMPELSHFEYMYATVDIIECSSCNEWYHDNCRKYLKNKIQMQHYIIFV